MRRSTEVYNTGVETHDRVYIIRRPVLCDVGKIGLIDFLVTI